MSKTDDLVEAVLKAARWFTDYEVVHRAKGTPEATAKAETNAARARELRRAAQAGCDHYHVKVGTIAPAFIQYECTKCGDEYEKDVS